MADPWPAKVDLSEWFGSKGDTEGRVGKGLSSTDPQRWTLQDRLKMLFITGGWMWFNPDLGDDWKTMKPSGALLHVMENVPLAQVEDDEQPKHMGALYMSSGKDRITIARVKGKRFMGPGSNSSVVPDSWYLTPETLKGDP